MPHYIYKKPLLRLIAGKFDQLGKWCWPFKARSIPKTFKSIAVIRLDQIGDQVLAGPFLASLKEQLSFEVRITLVTTPLGKSLFSSSSIIDQVEVCKGSWFMDGASFLRKISNWFQLCGLLRRVNADLIVDLRGDIRHIVASKIASPRSQLLSYGITGGGFLLDVSVPYQPLLHAAQKNLYFLSFLGLSIPSQPRLPSLASEELSTELVEVLHNTKQKIAIHMGLLEGAKSWPLRHWQRVIRVLAVDPSIELYAIGDEASGREWKKNISDKRVVNLCGRIPLSQLGTFLKSCDYLVTIDSGPAHVAAIHHVKTILLFSSANRLEEWKPLNSNCISLNHSVPCSPCYAPTCVQPHHDCMDNITPSEVIGHLMKGVSQSNEAPLSTLR